MPPSPENPSTFSEHSDGTGRCRLEFLVEPFTEGRPGPHVLGPLASLRGGGIEVNQGPFGNTVEGDRRTVTAATLTIVESALEKGASRILINLTQGSAPGRGAHPGRAATRANGGGGVRGPAGATEYPIAAGAAALGAGRPEDIRGAIDRIIRSVETSMGGDLGDLSREKKQAAVRILDEQGVFLIRKSVETVAEVMGVSRITIYNYLNAIRGD